MLESNLFVSYYKKHKDFHPSRARIALKRVPLYPNQIPTLDGPGANNRNLSVCKPAIKVGLHQIDSDKAQDAKPPQTTFRLEFKPDLNMLNLLQQGKIPRLMISKNEGSEELSYTTKLEIWDCFGLEIQSQVEEQVTGEPATTLETELNGMTYTQTIVVELYPPSKLKLWVDGQLKVDVPKTDIFETLTNTKIKEIQIWLEVASKQAFGLSMSLISHNEVAMIRPFICYLRELEASKLAKRSDTFSEVEIQGFRSCAEGLSSFSGFFIKNFIEVPEKLIPVVVLREYSVQLVSFHQRLEQFKTAVPQVTDVTSILEVDFLNLVRYYLEGNYELLKALYGVEPLEQQGGPLHFLTNPMNSNAPEFPYLGMIARRVASGLLDRLKGATITYNLGMCRQSPDSAYFVGPDKVVGSGIQESTVEISMQEKMLTIQLSTPHHLSVTSELQPNEIQFYKRSESGVLEKSVLITLPGDRSGYAFRAPLIWNGIVCSFLQTFKQAIQIVQLKDHSEVGAVTQATMVELLGREVLQIQNTQLGVFRSQGLFGFMGVSNRPDPDHASSHTWLLSVFHFDPLTSTVSVKARAEFPLRLTPVSLLPVSRPPSVTSSPGFAGVFFEKRRRGFGVLKLNTDRLAYCVCALHHGRLMLVGGSNSGAAGVRVMKKTAVQLDRIAASTDARVWVASFADKNVDRVSLYTLDLRF